MIGIINTGQKANGEQHIYKVFINEVVVCSFYHKQSDGLGRCLLEASKAVEKDKWGKVTKLLKKLDKGRDL